MGLETKCRSDDIMSRLLSAYENAPATSRCRWLLGISKVRSHGDEVPKRDWNERTPRLPLCCVSKRSSYDFMSREIRKTLSMNATNVFGASKSILTILCPTVRLPQNLATNSRHGRSKSNSHVFMCSVHWDPNSKERNSCPSRLVRMKNPTPSGLCCGSER